MCSVISRISSFLLFFLAKYPPLSHVSLSPVTLLYIMSDDETALHIFTSAEEGVLNKVYSRLITGQTRISDSRTPLQPFITKLRAQYSESFNRMLRINKLRETAYLRSILEQKLTHVEQQIEFLNESNQMTKSHPSTFKMKDRQEFYEEETRKMKENTEFARRLAEEQRERRRKRKQEAKELMRSAMEEQQKQQEMMKTQKIEAIARLKQTEKEKFSQLAAQRKSYMQSLSQLPLKKQPNPTLSPLNTRFRREIKPEPWENVKKHMQNYDEMKKKQSQNSSLERNLRQSPDLSHRKYQYNGLLEVLKQEEREIEENKAKEQEELMKRLKLQRQYGVIVKEMYAPTVDLDLKQEVEVRTQLFTKGNTQSMRDLREISTEKPKLDLIFTPKPVKSVKKPAKVDENPSKSSDYLLTLRQNRPKEHENAVKQLMSSDKKGVKAEKLAKQLDVRSSQGLAALEVVSGDLLTEVKRKLEQVKAVPRSG